MNGFDPIGEPNKFEKAHDLLVDALAALERQDITEALRSMKDARLVLEIEQQFRDARHARA